jgi:hypothetical protein
MGLWLNQHPDAGEGIAQFAIANAQERMRAAQRVTRKKPIIVVKSGRTEAGARAAFSHTGALAGGDVASSTLFDQCGVLRVNTIEELFTLATAFTSQPLPRGNRVALLTNAGGPAIMATDAAVTLGLTLAPLEENTRRILRKKLPPECSVANPVDLIASADADRSGISLNDHVQSIVEAIESAGRPAVLAVHSGAGASGYGATDRVPERIAELVYVDTGPPSGPLDAELEGSELPMPSPEDLAAEENLDGLSEEQLESFQRRAIPEPAGAVRDALELTNDARLDVPATVICTGFTSEQVKGFIEQGAAWIAALGQLRDVTYIDLPTSHWPMWSRPKELAEILGEVAQRHAA